MIHGFMGPATKRRQRTDIRRSMTGILVSNGAGGSTGASGFAMYVIDTDGDLREFEYSDRAKYEGLSRDDKVAGDELPDELEDDGTSCR
jgi:hypothetical protein